MQHDFSVVIPTRGDVDLGPIIASYGDIADEVLIWDNSQRKDLAVYGRYALIEEARNELILTQDDDVIVSDPEMLVKLWDPHDALNHIVCNMPAAFREQEFYNSGAALVGFGAVFHRDLPARVFARFHDHVKCRQALFHRECDRVFTYLTPKVLLDLPKQDLPWANADAALWRQQEHLDRRQEMLDLLETAFRPARTTV